MKSTMSGQFRQPWETKPGSQTEPNPPHEANDEQYRFDFTMPRIGDDFNGAVNVALIQAAADNGLSMARHDWASWPLATFTVSGPSKAMGQFASWLAPVGNRQVMLTLEGRDAHTVAQSMASAGVKVLYETTGTTTVYHVFGPLAKLCDVALFVMDLATKGFPPVGAVGDRGRKADVRLAGWRLNIPQRTQTAHDVPSGVDI